MEEGGGLPPAAGGCAPSPPCRLSASPVFWSVLRCLCLSVCFLPFSAVAAQHMRAPDPTTTPNNNQHVPRRPCPHHLDAHGGGSVLFCRVVCAVPQLFFCVPPSDARRTNNLNSCVKSSSFNLALTWGRPRHAVPPCSPSRRRAAHRTARTAQARDGSLLKSLPDLCSNTNAFFGPVHSTVRPCD